MPELPEVETMKNGISPTMVGVKIKKLHFNAPKLRYNLNQQHANALQGLKVLNITRRAKYLIIELENNYYIVMHAGMSGSFKVSKELNLIKHDHVVFELENGCFVVYNDPRRFGFCLIYKKEEFEKLNYLNKLGVEPFSANLNAKYLQQKLSTKKSPIKVALLNQEIIVGIGNIYASEILYKAKVSPLKPCNLVSLKELEDIIFYTKQILKQAIDLGGSTIKDHKNTEGKMGYFQNHFNVYGKKQCPNCTCSGGITKIIQCQRATYYCSLKQK